MDRIRRGLPAALLAGAALAATRPARACEPEALDAHLAAVCDGGLAAARAALAAALPQATPAERAALEAMLAEAGGLCGTGDPVEAARQAARIARIAGRIEGRAGTAPLDLPPTG